MKVFLATALAISAMTSVTFAQQAPVSVAAPAPQTGPAIPSATAVPEVIAPNDAPLPHAGRDVPPLASGDWATTGHHGHMAPPPQSKAAHFRIKNGNTTIDIKCAENEPTKVCADVLNQVLDKLTPSSGSRYDNDNNGDSDE